MPGFLFGLAVGLFVGVIVGIFTAALMQAARESEVDAIFARYREDGRYLPENEVDGSRYSRLLEKDLPIDLWPVDVTATRRIDVPLPRRDEDG